jgi:biuret amidohydrolase
VSQDTKRRQRLQRLLDPATTAVVTMELQRGIVGPAAMLPQLADRVAEIGMMDIVGGLCTAARAAGVRVVHNTAEHRSDDAGYTENCTIFAIGAKLARESGIRPTEIGSEGAKLMPQLGDDPRDIKVPRMHGMSPFMSTSLDQMLRNLGIRTIIAAGVSVNMGITGLCLNGVDLGYQVVLPRDCVAGVPADFADAAIQHTLSLLATVTTAAEIQSVWQQMASSV